jgi:FemAB-related protein (PEP-CTERM system-associated)
MMALEELNLYSASDMSPWDAFVKNHPEGSVFHSSSWLRVIREAYSFEPLLYISRNVNGEISGVLPFFVTKSPLLGKHMVSLPFSDYGGALFSDSNGVTDFLTQVMSKHKRHMDYFEIRNAVPESSGMYRQSSYKRHVLQLFPDPKDNMKKIDKRTIQYSIRKAQREGVVVSEENNQKGLEEFCRLNRMTRKKHGLPYQPELFFEKLFEHLISKGDASILLATCDTLVIAAGLFLKFNKFVYYKYNASDPNYLTKKTPNHLLTWHAIERACLEGYVSFDFGRTSVRNDGLIRYKEMWGAETFDLPYFFYPEMKTMKTQEEKSPVYRMATKIWHSLPESMVDFIGPRVYKYLG